MYRNTTVERLEKDVTENQHVSHQCPSDFPVTVHNNKNISILVTVHQPDGYYGRIFEAQRLDNKEIIYSKNIDGFFIGNEWKIFCTTCYITGFL